MSQSNHLNAYFKRASSWADDQFGRVEQSCRRYQAAFLVAMGCNLVSMCVIGMLAHYQTVVPMLIHHYDNGVTTVEPIANDHVPLNHAQVESDIVRYIQHREAYDVSSYRAQFELVNLLSDNTVEKEYLTEQDKSNPAAPIRMLGNHVKREVHIYSINFLDAMLANEKDIHKDHHSLAEVVFSLTDVDKLSGKTTVSHFNAMISWHYRAPPESPQSRWHNWDGFEVTRYSKQPRQVEAHS
ncbi:MAG: type IV secretion system protein [Legionellales bacterium]|nr:type IV secretion system protein [Legionellales bacterium]